MNEQAFIQYISFHLRTNISTYTCSGVFQQSYCAVYDYTDPIIYQSNLLALLLDFSDGLYPKLITVNNQITYAAISVSTHIYIIGPVKFTEPVSTKHKEINYKMDPQWIKSVFTCDFREFINDILMVYNLYHKHMLNAETLIALNCIDAAQKHDIHRRITAITFERRENEIPHNPYDEEIRELDSIEHGDITKLEKCWETDYSLNYGSLSKDIVRNAKNLCIVVIALASRASIKGGVQPEVAFTLCDSYIQKIEECRNTADLPQITHNASRHYAQMVADIRCKTPHKHTMKITPHITKCKDYIFAHLHDKITVQEIADELHLNANYLSELFKKYEGSSIMQFVMKEKMVLAQNMLMYSPYTYSEIATYLGFSSQSHLGTQFKKIMNMTLRDYRIKYGVSDSTSE